jgi:hypothetical protein
MVSLLKIQQRLNVAFHVRLFRRRQKNFTTSTGISISVNDCRISSMRAFNASHRTFVFLRKGILNGKQQRLLIKNTKN